MSKVVRKEEHQTKVLIPKRKTNQRLWKLLFANATLLHLISNTNSKD
jgi:hypothetical protein